LVAAVPDPIICNFRHCWERAPPSLDSDLVSSRLAHKAMVAHSKSRAWLFMNLLDRMGCRGTTCRALQTATPPTCIGTLENSRPIFDGFREQSGLPLALVTPFDIPHRVSGVVRRAAAPLYSPRFSPNLRQQHSAQTDPRSHSIAQRITVPRLTNRKRGQTQLLPNACARSIYSRTAEPVATSGA